METFKTVLEVIRKDWAKLPNFVKFCFLVGFIAILTTFAVEPYEITIFSKSYYFWLSISIVALTLILPSLYWACVEMKVWYYRFFRYPLRNIGNKFQFVRVKDHDAVLIVFGKNKKKARWIENGRTMYDLGFEPYYRHFIESNPLDKDNIRNYKLKKSLRTRRKPGGLSDENS